MIETQLIENVLSALFGYLNKKVLLDPRDSGKFDFIIKGDHDQRIAIEIKGQSIRGETLRRIALILHELHDIDEFYLITPQEPSNEQISIFKGAFKNIKVKAHWVGIINFIAAQNLGFNLRPDLNSALLNLQVAATTANFNKYSHEHIGSQLGYSGLINELKERMEVIERSRIDVTNIVCGLARQFPYKIITEIKKKSTSLSKSLYFGKKYSDAIIVLSDIQNFSEIVTNSDPDELFDLMNRYYKEARNLVFKYDGILDKFIGDAVFAIFNYPSKGPESYTKAIKFCSELIVLGKNILGQHLDTLDSEVKTGTRIGITNGPIYPLNIGKDIVEVTFLADKINLAARLEKNCEVNGILLSNRYFHKLESSNPEMKTLIGNNKRRLKSAEVHGQPDDTVGWQITEDQIKLLL